MNNDTTKRFVQKVLPKNQPEVNALNGVLLTLPDKGCIALLGRSGSGKSTMLNILGGLDNYDDGDMLVDGKSTSSFTQPELDSYRSEYIGIIFQDYNLTPEYNDSENIALALELQGKTASDEEIRVALKTVDMEGYAGRRSTELSGGKRQRVAIARAIIKKPKLVLADEPTGNLDSETSTQIFEVLKELSKEALVIVITHDREYAEKYADRIIELVDGKVVKDSNPLNAEELFCTKNSPLNGVAPSLGKNKVFLIFLAEALIIVLITYPLGMLGSWGLVRFFNNDFIKVAKEAGYRFYYLRTDWIVCLANFFLSAAVAFLGSYVPISKMANKKPIDVIRD